MKRLNLFLTAFLIAICASAEEPLYKHNLEITLGEPSALEVIHWAYRCGCGPAEASEVRIDQTAFAHYQASVILPSANIKYHYQASPLFAMGVVAGYDLQYVLYMLNDKHLRQMSHNIYALFSMRWSWLRKQKVECYSGVAIGVGADIYNPDHKPVSNITAQILPALQCTAIGLKVGSGRCYWTAEVGYGDLGCFNTGIGIRL